MEPSNQTRNRRRPLRAAASTRSAVAIWAFFVATALISCLGCGSNRLSHPKDWTSVSITLERTDCQLPCPVYDVTVRGNGEVEYQGHQGVPVRGHAAATLPREKIVALLDALDRAKFASMHDASFQVVSDLPYVIVSLSEDGARKQVKSVYFGAGQPDSATLAKHSLLSRLFNGSAKEQSRFLLLADQLDSLIGTDRWIKCNTKCMRLVRAPSWLDSRDADGSTILLRAIQSRKDVLLGSFDFDPGTMIAAGVDVNAPNRQGVTPLMAAAKNGDVELIAVLLAHGAAVEAKDTRGLGAADYAPTPAVRAVIGTSRTTPSISR